MPLKRTPVQPFKQIIPGISRVFSPSPDYQRLRRRVVPRGVKKRLRFEGSDDEEDLQDISFHTIIMDAELPDNLEECRKLYDYYYGTIAATNTAVAGFAHYLEGAFSEHIGNRASRLVRKLEEAMEYMEQYGRHVFSCFGNGQLMDHTAKHKPRFDENVHLLMAYIRRGSAVADDWVEAEKIRVLAELEQTRAQIDAAAALPANILAPAVAPAAAGPAGPAVPNKNGNLYKPTKLLHSFKMNEFRGWKTMFLAYYNASELANCDNATQLALLSLILDQTLREAVTSSCPINIGTYGVAPVVNGVAQNTLNHMAALDLYFDEQFPLHIRRGNLIKLTPTSGQNASSFIEETIASINTAEIHNCTLDQFLAQLTISKLPDEHIKQTLMQRRIPPTIQEALQASKTIELSYKNDSNLSSSSVVSTNSNRGSGKRRGRGGKSQPSGTRKAANGSQNSLPPDTCWVCGDKTHRSSECTVKNPHCTFCKMNNHLAVICSKRLAQANGSANMVNEPSPAADVSDDSDVQLASA